MILYPWYLLSFLFHFSFFGHLGPSTCHLSLCRRTEALLDCLPQVFPPPTNPPLSCKNDVSNICSLSDYAAGRNSLMATALAPAPCFSPCLPHSHLLSPPSSGLSLGTRRIYRTFVYILPTPLAPIQKARTLGFCVHKFRTRASICVLAQGLEVLGRAICLLMPSPLLLPPLNFCFLSSSRGWTFTFWCLKCPPALQPRVKGLLLIRC